jgi:hypothetical protein
MTGLDSIVSLSTRACFLMSAGRYGEAGHLFSHCLQEVQKSPALCSSSQSSLPRREDLFLHPVQLGTGQRDSSSFLFYNWAFLALEVDPKDASALPSTGLSCATLLYNIGLCYHAMGMTEKVKQKSFHAALHIYSHALAILSSCGEQCSILNLALLNNRGCLLEYFCEFQAAQECLVVIDAILQASFPITADEAKREDILEIQMNVAMLLGLHPHASAA